MDLALHCIASPGTTLNLVAAAAAAAARDIKSVVAFAFQGPKVCGSLLKL